MSDERSYTESSGNVFADLGVADPEEALAKAVLAHKIANIIEHRGLTQVRAAEILGIDQPKVAALTRGRLAGFSVDQLSRLLNALDQNVEITVIPTASTQRQAKIAVASE